MIKSVILTGLRANGELHLGNYLGGILPMVQLQQRFSGEYQLNMFVPDLHSFTTPIDHSQLYRNSLHNLKVFVAAGLDVNDSDTHLYRQSFVPMHSELAWILECFSYFGELGRMTEFKDKSSRDGADAESINAGLFNYPVLMAADILLYGAVYVPVGEDQRQHLELTRTLAQRLNNKFQDDLFVVPASWDDQMKFVDRNAGVRIKSLRNPSKKMSKSVDDPAGTILLSDTPTAAAKKIMSAETDSIGVVHYDPLTQPGISNLLQILALLSDTPLTEVTRNWEGTTSYGALKTAVSGAVEAFLVSFQAKLADIDEAALLQALESGEQLMRDVAGTQLYKVQQAIGLRL